MIDIRRKIKYFIITFTRFFKFYNLKSNVSRTFHFIKNFRLPITLYKMLVRSFLFWFSIAQGLFIVIFLIFDFFTKIDDYIPNKVPFHTILYISLLLLPKALWLTMPVAIMFGIIMSIASLYQNNELIAVFTSGVSIYKFVIPLIAICLLLSFAMIFIDSYVVIPTFRYRENLFEHVTHSAEKEENMTIKDNENYFWTVEEFDSSNNMLKNIIIFKLDENYRMIYRLDASSAIYTKDGWLVRNGTLREWNTDGELEHEVKIYKKILDNLIEKPKTFKQIFSKSDYEIEKMTIPEARKRIELLEDLNIFHWEEKNEFYKKFSFPFTLVIVCLFAIGVSTLSQKNILILSLFFSIGLAILYYVAQMILDVLTTSGKLPPLLSAWLAILMFLPAALILVSKAKT